MAYIVPIHKPTSVRHALKLCLLDSEQTCLVVAKANQLHIYRQDDETLVFQSSQTIYGSVTMLQRLRPASSPTDHLFVGTDRYTYFTLSWDAKRRKLKTEKTYMDTADSGARDSHTGMKCLVDPKGNWMMLELYEGILTTIPIIRKLDKIGRKKGYELGNVGYPASTRIAELCVRSAAFLAGSVKPKLALLYEDGYRKVQLVAKELDFIEGASSESSTAEWRDTDTKIAYLPDEGASHIIPIPEPVLGLLILGESTVTYVDDSNNQIKVIDLDRPTIFVAWAQYDATRFLVADDFGILYLIELEVDGKVFLSCEVYTVGEISRATVLVPFGQDLLFVGSHQGDSQVVKLDLTARSREVIQTIPNIAPILDMTIMDMGREKDVEKTNDYSSGQARIVTGSGAFQNGSLRSIRSGVGLEDQGILGEMEGIQSLFGLRTSNTSSKHDLLVVSFIDETRLFRFFGEGEIEEIEACQSLTLSESTLFVADVSAGRRVQVTESAIKVFDTVAGSIIKEWRPPGNQHITDARASGDRVLAAIDGRTLIVFDLDDIIARRSFDGELEIACLTLFDGPRPIGVVGFWNSAEIALVDLANLETIHKETVINKTQGSFPRDLVVAQILPDERPTLFVSMADGVVCTYSLDPVSLALSGAKTMVMGTQQARLQPIPRGNGMYNIFATCEHPAVIYGSEGRIVYSAVTAEDAICVCPFDTVAYPDAVVIATATELKIALVDEERRTHVKDLQLGETVRRIAYSEKLSAFTLGTIQRKTARGMESIRSHIKLVDEVNFELLDTYPLKRDELVESVIRAELGRDQEEEKPTERFVIGTGYLKDGSNEPLRGRIIVFEVSEDRKLHVVAEVGLRGACRCLGIVDGCIVAGLIKTVAVFKYDESSSKPELIKGATYRTSTAPIDLTVTGNTIAIADLMKSVSVVEFRRGADGLPDTLTETARHYSTAWGTAVACVDDDSYLESDAEGNLMMLVQDRNGVTEDDQRRLKVTSKIRLGEMVNKIRRITVPVSPDAVVIPRAFLATVDGSVYLFALITSRYQNLLMLLQTKLAKLGDSLGHLPFNKYRAFKSSVEEDEEPDRFVDGELIEKFLDCTETTQEDLVDGLGVDVEEVRVMIEGLRRLH